MPRFLYVDYPPPPIITNTSTVLTQGASQPFASNLNLSGFSKNYVVVTVGYGRNQNRTFGTTTLAGASPTGSVLSEDNSSADRAGFAIYWWATTSTSSSAALSISLNEGNPDSWRVQWFGLSGVNSVSPTVTTNHSETDSTALKTITMDTTAYRGRTTLIGGRCHARSSTITNTLTTATVDAGGVEDSDAGSSSQSVMVAHIFGMAPQSLAFGSTGSATDDGDAMAAVAFRG